MDDPPHVFNISTMDLEGETHTSQIEGWITGGGLCVHHSLMASGSESDPVSYSPNRYTVSHLHTGLCIIPQIDNLDRALELAVEAATFTNWNRSATDINNTAFDWAHKIHEMQVFHGAVTSGPTRATDEQLDTNINPGH